VTKRSDDARAACRSPEAHSWPTIRRSIALDGNFPFAMTKSASAPTLPLGDEERTDAGELLYVGAEACGCQAELSRLSASPLVCRTRVRWCPGRAWTSVELDGRCRVAHGDPEATSERRSRRGSGETRQWWACRRRFEL
jgi:hypothetical protein